MLPENIDDETMKMDGFDECIIGTAERYGMPTVIAYDKEKVLDKLIDDGMSIEEAEEFFEYNQLGAWVGETTPVFITLNPKETLPCPEKSNPTKN